MKKIPYTQWLLIGACLVSLSVSVLTLITRPSMAVFDVKRTLTQFQHQLIEKGVTQAEHQAYLTHFAQALERATAQYSQEHNVLILTTPAVVAGADDITTVLQQHIIEQYQQRGQG